VKNNLTATQAEIFEFVVERYRTTGVSPSFREIQEHFGYKAIGTVQDHMRALLKKGVLENAGSDDKTGARRARGLIPAGPRPQGTKQIPIYGEIAAGAPRDAHQIEMGTLTVSRQLAREPGFALRVVGNSMIDAGILEGDILIVERSEDARSGDIVVALLNGETTVKRYLERGRERFLIPENQTMKPIPVTHEDFRIQGRVIALQRKF